MKRLRAVCPNDPAHKRFFTTAVEIHEWDVDEFGECVKDNGISDILRYPDSSVAWVCIVCTIEATLEKVEVKKSRG